MLWLSVSSPGLARSSDSLKPLKKNTSQSNYLFSAISVGMLLIHLGKIMYYKCLSCLHICLSVKLTLNVELMLFCVCVCFMLFMLTGTTRARPSTWSQRTTQRLAVSSAQWGPMRWVLVLIQLLSHLELFLLKRWSLLMFNVNKSNEKRHQMSSVQAKPDVLYLCHGAPLLSKNH